MTRTYFATLRTTDGEYKTFIWESDSKKGTWNNVQDLLFNTNENIDTDSYRYASGRYRGVRVYKTYIYNHVYLMNKKNMEEDCFGDYEIIDVRKKGE